MYKILFVDDDIALRNVVSEYFNERQYDIICTASAAKTIDYLKSTSIDCVILDVDLPDSNGLDVYKRQVMAWSEQACISASTPRSLPFSGPCNAIPSAVSCRLQPIRSRIRRNCTSPCSEPKCCLLYTSRCV